MKVSTLKKILKKYAAGKASETERFVIDRWYDSFEENGKWEPEDEARRKRLLAKLMPSPELKPWFKHRTWWVAASLLLGLGVLLSLYLDLSVDKEVNGTAPRAVQIFETGVKQLKKIQLSDSSLVWINAESVLEVAGDYGKTNRRVRLKGEAFFEVKENPMQPFEVTIDGLAIDVLGTSFNVQAYADLPHSEISVRTGRVRVKNQEHVFGILSTDEFMRYDTENKTVKIQALRVAKDSWREGKVYLQKASFPELARALRNIYGVQLQSENKLVKGFKYNLPIRSDQHIDSVMEVVASILNKQYKKEGTHVIIK